LRASDIAKLEFGNLDLINSTIKLVQTKTKLFLTLPLLDEIKKALDDYITGARPNSDDTHIFLNERGYGVVSPVGIGAIVHKALMKSGIDCEGRKTGSHSLRSSLATSLLMEGNDYLTIQKVLGQKDIQSSKAYVKADVEQLRTNALPVPPPTGFFADSIKRGGDAE